MTMTRNISLNSQLPHLLKPSQVRRLLCCGRYQFARALQAGQLPQPVEIAGRLVFRLKDIAPILVLAGLADILPPDLAAADDESADDSA